MAFDFDALMQDPQFQMGLGILGGASPGHAGLLNAYNIMQQRKKAEIDAQMKAREMQLEDARAQQAREQARLYGVQVQQQQRKLDQQEAMQQRGLEFLERLRSGGQPAQQTPQPTLEQPQTPLAPAQPQVEVGKYGTPKAILDNLMQVESGGNPYAIGPDIGGGVKAQGAFQFLPSTVKMLKDKGLEFNPFNPEQARDAADFYIQDLAKQHGGDYAKALAAYGGFKTKDASSYVSRVMQGSPEKQAQQIGQLQAQAQLQSQSEAYKRAQQEVGALRFMGGDVGGLSDVVQGMKPDYEAQRLQTEQGGLDVRQQAELREQAKETRMAAEKARERTEAKTQDWRSFASTSANLDLLEGKTSELISHPGLKGIYGIPGAVFDIPGSAAANARTLHRSVVSQIAKETLTAVREASKTGGAFGNVSDKDVQLLETAVANLDKAQSPKSAVEAMNKVKEHTERIRNMAITAFEKLHGESPINPAFPVGTRKIGTSKGKAVYQFPDGKRVIEE